MPEPAPVTRAILVASEFYTNAINVMRGAEAVSAYTPIDEAEKFRIEYWALEEAKLCLLYTSPSPRDGLLSRMPSSA